MVEDNPEMETSPLSREFAQDGVKVRVDIYRQAGSIDGWSLEVVDYENASHVWDQLFPTDRDAYDEFVRTVGEETIHTFSEPSSEAGH